MKDQKDDFADLLGRYLDRMGFTQQELANKVGVHRNTIVNWLNRTSRPPRRGQVLRLADELALSKQERKALISTAGFSLEQWPTEIWTVPQQRDMFFTGRDHVFQSLRESLVTGSTTALTQAISGLGGIGKTHTAVEYAYRFHQDYEAVLWLQADSWKILVSECIKLADVLELPQQKEADLAIAEVQRWFQKHRHWLLVLDNVENPQEILPKFVPTGHQGCVLITTRVHDVEPLAQTQVLPTMSEQEGILFLLRRTRKVALKARLDQASAAQHNEARKIWQLMQGLPLALDQAGAYILETGCSFSAYQERYARRRAELLDRRGKRFIGHEESVATTFSLAFERVEALNPVAADILQVCSLLHSEAIPEELFQDGAEYLGPHLSVEREGLDLAIGVLQDYSLIERNTDAKTLTMHRLVQAVAQDILSTEEHIEWTKRTTIAIQTIFPREEFGAWSQCERCLPHVLACVSNIEKLMELPWLYTLPLFLNAGRYLYQRGRYSEAELLCTHALAARELWLESEDLSMIEPLSALAALYKSQGKYKQAEPLYKRALAICQQLFGIENPQTALSMSNLAEFYQTWGSAELLQTRDGAKFSQTQGKYEQAEPLYKRALATLERQLGAKDFSTALCVNNLATLYMEQGKYEQAESLYKRALAVYEQELEPEHPETIRLLNNLAILFQNQGKYEQAESLHKRVLAIREHHLGPKHPDVATTLSDLAYLYHGQEKFEQAESFYKQSLAVLQQTFDAEHPLIAATLQLLARLYIEQGKYEQVEKLFQEAFSTQKQGPGVDHSDVAGRLNDLALLYQKQGKYEQAEKLLQRALATCEQRLGDEHLDIVYILINLAALYHAQGKYEQAELLYKRALAVQEQQLGTEHPDIASTLTNLALLCHGQEEYEQAELLYKRALVIREQQSGDEHLLTSVIHCNLALLYTAQEKYEQAEMLYEQAFTDYQRELGIEDSRTVDCFANWIRLYRLQGKDQQIERLYRDVVVPGLSDQATRYHAQGKYEQAESLFQQALSLCEPQSETEQLDTVPHLNDLARLYIEQGKYEQAEPLFQRALAIQEQQLGDENPNIVPILNNLAFLSYKQGKHEQAELFYKRALAIQEQQLGDGHLLTSAVLNGLASLYAEQRKHEQAESLYIRALAIQEQLEEHLHTTTTLNNLALLSHEQGKYEQAMSWYVRALNIQKQRSGSDLPHTIATLNDAHTLLSIATTLDNMALLCIDLGAYEQAQLLCQQALLIYEQRLGSEHPDAVIALNKLAIIYYRQRKYKQAERLYQRVLSIREQTLGLYHPKTVETRKSYATLLQKMGKQGEAASFKSPRPEQRQTEEKGDIH